MNRQPNIVPCRGCAARIRFLRTKVGRSIPVNVTPTVDRFRAPRDDESDYVHGEHEPHHATCPAADQFRRRK